MRILYVCSDPLVSPLGGDATAAHVRAVTGALAARGHSVVLGCRRTDGGNRLAPGVSVAVLPEGWHEQARWMVDQMRRLGIDVLIERQSLRSGPSVDATDLWPIPLLFHVTAPLVDDAARDGTLDDAPSWRRWESRLLSAADHVIAVSEVVAWHALASGVPRDRCSVVPNGVDPARFERAEGHSVRLEYDLRRSFVIGCSGGLESWHGLDDVVEALAMLPPSVRLLVVGQGPQQAEIRRFARRLGVDNRVAIAEGVSEAEVPAFMAAFDAGVAAYTAIGRFYYSPLELLEYCAAGLPVVATAQDDTGSLGGAALLVPPADPTALAEAIARLVDDELLRERMSQAARAHAAGHTWEDAAARIEELVTGMRRRDREHTRTSLR